MTDISIIIPVYNVQDYIDECMRTVVNQTFRNYEVILINDGSTDHSGEKCKKWAEKDLRIKYIEKKNEGLSPTRNLGLKEAEGEYISFIDPDDWVDVNFLEILIKRARETASKIVECDLYRVNNNTGKRTYKISSGSIGIKETLEEHMIYGNTTLCKCLIHKSLFRENLIEFPECHSPARGIYALLLALSGKVENVNEGLYYYRIFRPGSLTEKPRENIENTEIGIQAFEYLLNEFRRCKLYEKYKEVIERSIKYKLSDLLAVFFQRNELNSYIRMKDEYKFYLCRWFPESINREYMVLGGYNLNRIAWSMRFLHDPNSRFNFSSLISIMHPAHAEEKCEHKNIYREIMIKRDIASSFWDYMKCVYPQFVIIDFIEERFDIIAGWGGYITKSDAWDDIACYPEDARIVYRKSTECDELWKDSCTQFISKIHKEFPKTKIILVKNYLSLTYGNINKQYGYENRSELIEMNKRLKAYYEYFEENCGDVRVVETQTLNYYFTDEKYAYGVVPSHLNDIVNREIAKKIEVYLGE